MKVTEVIVKEVGVTKVAAPVTLLVRTTTGSVRLRLVRLSPVRVTEPETMELVDMLVSEGLDADSR